MRGRKRIISFIAVLSVLLIFSGFFALKNVLSPGTASVSVYPASVVKDYTLMPVNSKFIVHVNVSAVATGLFSWQLNVSYNKAILNVSRILTGANDTYILYRTGSADKTSSNKLGYVINSTDNTKGYTGIAETILGDVAGVTSSDWLRLVSIEFLVVGYGWTELNISVTGILATKLLDSTGTAFTLTVTDGWFDNRVTGDVDSSEIVSMGDANELRTRWLSTPTSGPYARSADLNLDGVISMGDANIVRANWLRTRP